MQSVLAVALARRSNALFRPFAELSAPFAEPFVD